MLRWISNSKRCVGGLSGAVSGQARPTAGLLVRESLLTVLGSVFGVFGGSVAAG
jgi:hypothetical protein